jgi:hypothetical protein
LNAPSGFHHSSASVLKRAISAGSAVREETGRFLLMSFRNTVGRFLPVPLPPQMVT